MPRGRWTIMRVVAGVVTSLIFTTALVFRIVGLEHLPGINADEAYYGSVVMAFKAGENPELTTVSGLPLNPFYSGLLYLIHSVVPTPSFWILRMPALLSGLALLALAHPLLAQVFDRTTALRTTLLLACLPIAIAYSRFGWDQSQAPLASLLCLYFALKRQLLGASVTFSFAMIVHPINVFLAPIVLGPMAAEWTAQRMAKSPAGAAGASTAIQDAEQVARPATEEPGSPRHVLLVLIAALAICALFFVWRLVPAKILQSWQANMLPGIGRRLVNPLDWGRYALLYSDFLTGTTIYRYVAGPVPEWSVGLQRLAFVGILAILLIRGLPRLVREHDLPALGLLAGLGISLAACYLVIGPHAIGPGLERYAMWLVTPSCLALALLLRATGDSVMATRLQLGLWIVCSLLLVGFQLHYFEPLLETGGNAHRTFRTGPVEPKQAAFEAIEEVCQRQPATILAEDYWTFVPLYYLARGRPELRVVQCKEVKVEDESQRRFLVGFAGGPSEQWLATHAPALRRQVIIDYADRPVLYVWDLGTNSELLAGLKAAAATVPRN